MRLDLLGRQRLVPLHLEREDKFRLVDLIRSKNLPTDSYDKISAFLLSKTADIDADGVDWRHNKWVDTYYRGVKQWENTELIAPTSYCKQFTGPNAPP